MRVVDGEQPRVACLGWLVVALALGFLGHQLWRSNPWSLAGAHAAELALAVGMGTLAYGLAGFLLAEAWRHLLGPGPAEADPWRHRALYGRTQIAKYLPGNCFHLIGRQVLGKRLGHGHGALVLASLAEAASLLLVAGALALPLVWSRIERTLGMPPGWLVLATAGVGRRPDLPERRPRPRVAGAGGAPCRRRDRQLGAARAAGRAAPCGVLRRRRPGSLGRGGRAPGSGRARPRPDHRRLEHGHGLVAGLRGARLVGRGGRTRSGPGAGARPYLAGDGALLIALALRLITTFGDLLFFALCVVMPWGVSAGQDARQANRRPIPPILK